MSFLPTQFVVTHNWTDSQRGLFEVLVSDVARFYFPQVKRKKAADALKQRLKDKHGYQSSTCMTPTQYKAAMLDLQIAILAKQPKHFINRYSF